MNKKQLLELRVAIRNAIAELEDLGDGTLMLVVQQEWLSLSDKLSRINSEGQRRFKNWPAQ